MREGGDIISTCHAPDLPLLPQTRIVMSYAMLSPSTRSGYQPEGSLRVQQLNFQLSNAPCECSSRSLFVLGGSSLSHAWDGVAPDSIHEEGEASSSAPVLTDHG